MSKKENNNVTVGVRIRPRNEKEIQANMPVYFSSSEDAHDVQELNEDGLIVKRWSYDNVFGPDCSNSFIFDTMGQKLVDAAIDGYNSVLFMYGQTSSGKTFTLFGGGGTAGIVMHSMEYLHSKIMASTDLEFVVRLTYSELYNEELKDLLATTPSSEGLKIIDDPNLGPLIQNITEANFTSAQEIKQLLEEGENRRHFGVTNMNAHSSRSHVMVRLSIETRKVHSKPTHPLRQSWGKDKPTCVSTLNLVDLAGSERANKSGTSGQALKEGSFINKSLLTLGTVISNLSEGKLAHIPYRNSKLTRLLATALGGNAKTCMITCISPASGNVMESLSTLRFASRAKRIVNVVHKNEIMNMKTLTSKLAQQSMEMDMLRAKLELSRQMGFVDDENQPGVTIKDKAVSVSKNMRNLRFLMTNAPKLVKGLRKAGKKALVKKVQDDLKAAISGQRELSEIIEEHTNLIAEHLPDDRKLLLRVQQLVESNESELIMDTNEQYIGDGEGGGGDEYEHMSDSDSDDFGVLDLGAEEMMEQLEGAHLLGEDGRAEALRRIYQLEAEIADRHAREKDLLAKYESQQIALAESDESLKRHVANEASLQQHITKCEGELDTVLEKGQRLTQRVGELEVTVGDREAEVRSKMHEILAKDAEMLKLKTQCEQLENDLNAAVASRKTFEDETARARSDMRVQMDKMRNTMHHMLLQGGQEAKVIEAHNSQLQNELDAVKDYLEEEVKSKERLETEMSHLRGNIAILQEEQRSHMEEITVCREENANASERLRDIRTKLTQCTAALTVSEEHALKLERQLADEVANREDQLAAQQTEHRAKVEQLESAHRALHSAHEHTKLELASAQEQLKSKADVITRLEYTLTVDTARFEKKISMEVKHCDDLKSELSTANKEVEKLHNKHFDEVKSLKHKISELQDIVDSVNRHLEDQKDLYDFSGMGSVGGGGSICGVGDDYSDYGDLGSRSISRATSFVSDLGGASGAGGSIMVSPDKDPMLINRVSFTLGPPRSLPVGDGVLLGDESPAVSPLPVPPVAIGDEDFYGATEVDEYGNEVKQQESKDDEDVNSLASLSPKNNNSRSGGGVGATGAITPKQQRAVSITTPNSTSTSGSNINTTAAAVAAATLAGGSDNNGGGIDESSPHYGPTGYDVSPGKSILKVTSVAAAFEAGRSATPSPIPPTFSSSNYNANNNYYTATNNNLLGDLQFNHLSPVHHHHPHPSAGLGASATASAAAAASPSPSIPSRTDRVVQKQLEAASPRFQRLLKAMKVVTTALVHSVQDDRVLRGFLLDQYVQNSDQAEADGAALQQLQDHREYLEEHASNLQSSLAYTRELERVTNEKVTMLESEYDRVKGQYAAAVHDGQHATARANKFEQMYLDQHLLLEKIRQEKKHFMDVGQESKVEVYQLQMRVEEKEEDMSVMRSKMELIEQEMGVLKVERDELMKRFLNTTAAGMKNMNTLDSTASPPPPTPPPAAGAGGFGGQTASGFGSGHSSSYDAVEWSNNNNNNNNNYSRSRFSTGSGTTNIGNGNNSNSSNSSGGMGVVELNTPRGIVLPVSASPNTGSTTVATTAEGVEGVASVPAVVVQVDDYSKPVSAYESLFGTSYLSRSNHGNVDDDPFL